MPPSNGYRYEFDTKFGLWSLKPKELTGKYKELWDDLFETFIKDFENKDSIKKYAKLMQKNRRIYIGLITAISRTTDRVKNDNGVIGDKRNMAILTTIGEPIKQLISYHKEQVYLLLRKRKLINLFRNESNDFLFKILERIKVDGSYRHKFSIIRYATQHMNEADIPLLNSIISDRRNGKMNEILD